MSQILVITSLPDPHVEMVKKYLPTKTSIKIFDPRVISQSGEFTIDGDGIHCNFLDEIPKSVWFRKPKFLLNSDMKKMGVPEEYISSILSLHEEGFSIIYSAFLGSRWVSDPYAIKKASNKLLQLQIAKESGFKTPKTIFSTKVTDINNLRAEVEDIVMKPLGTPFARVSGTTQWFYATEIKKDQEIDFAGISTTPMIFQEKIQKEFDVRITVIGEEIFACKIESANMDWRKAESSSDTIFSEFHLDSIISKSCLSMTKKLGLNFGAFDFVVNGNNEFIFLEINPNGQWGFIEERTHMPLAKAMADFLC